MVEEGGEKVIDGWDIVGIFILVVVVVGFIWATMADDKDEIV